jgi:predicted transcriptional regulator
MSESADCVAMAVRIVTAYLTKNSLSPEEVPGLLRDIHVALRDASSNGGSPPRNDTPAVPVKRSVTADRVVCLVCGIELQSLKRHLGSRHDLTPEAYRARFRLAHEHPIVAPNYSQTRSRLAVRSGLGRKVAGRRARR